MEEALKQKIIDFFKRRKLLTETEFLQKMKPTNEMTYGEIKETIYEPEIFPNHFFIETNPEAKSMFSSIKETNNRKIVLPEGKINESFSQFSSAYWHCRSFIMDAFRDSHIECSDYRTVLLLKIQSLQNALLWWLIIRDKFPRFIADKLEIEKTYMNKSLRNKFSSTILQEAKNKTKDEEMKEIIKVIKNYKGKKIDICYEKKTTTLQNLANDIKHNEDFLSTISMNVIEKDFENSTLEKLFYQDILCNLILELNEYIEIVNKAISIFEEQVSKTWKSIQKKTTIARKRNL